MVDEAVVADKLRHINDYTDDLREMRGISKERYTSETPFSSERSSGRS
ncbi:hypothetical protein [Haloarcula salina]|uniref:Uncharacterized protein n=1 Tax=Haloarcula salina TaxID=1429914 RepID=A0AA41G0W6_9EURY|nr:hypothetical protein [Haloarcula salina]MBV0902218.1 hypothetical protein [Haloarcula salina]